LRARLRPPVQPFLQGSLAHTADDVAMVCALPLADNRDMLRKITLVITFALLCVSVCNVGAQKQDDNDRPFIIAVFRTDGVVVPFARYANQKWTNPWQSPRADDQAYETETIADLPKPWYESFVKTPAEWYLLSPASGELTVRASKSVEVCSHCQQVWGLLSDYPKATPAGRNECVRTLGVALSERRPSRAMERLTDSSPDWKQLLTLIAPQFEHAEIAALTFEHALLYASQLPSAEDRAKLPLSMQKLYRHRLTDDGQTLLYFEASRKYQKPPDSNDPSCENISMFGGWALRDAQGNLALLHSQFAPTDCDRKQVGLAFPFAILNLDGKTFAVIEEDSYEGESYIILEIRKDGVHRILETYAGSC